jgi:hypothetical protein
MRVALTLALLLLLVAGPATARRSEHLDQTVDTPVYSLREDLPELSGRYDYSLRWSGLPVARVSLDMRRSADANAVDLAIVGATHPVIDLFWRYRFDGRGRVATAPFGPRYFEVEECERSRLRRTEITFGGADHRVQALRHSRGKVREYWFRSDNTYDIPSAVYLVLNLDYTLGGSYSLDTFTGKSRYLVHLDVEARETIEIGGAKRDAWRLGIRTEELTDDDDDGRHRKTEVWISPEHPRTLLRARSETYVGAITLELEGDGAGTPLRASRCGNTTRASFAP